MGLRDVLKRLKKGAENTGGFLEDVALGGGSRGGFDVSDYYHGVGRLMETVGISDKVLGGLEAAGMDTAIDKAKAYLQQHAPGVRSSLDFFDMNPSAADRAEYGRNPFANTQKTFEGFANIGQQAAGEPIAYGLNKIPVIGNDEVQVGGQTIKAGGPWSGLQRQALLQGGANAGGAADVAAKAGVAGINVATNPLTYAPTSHLPLLGQLALGFEGVGGFGGASAPAQVARALAGGAGMAAGADIAGRLTGGNPIAELAGGFAGAALAHRAGAATPGVSGLFKDAEGAVRAPNPRLGASPPSPVEMVKGMLRPPVLAAEEGRPLTGDVFIRGVPSPEAARMDLQRGTSLHQYGGDLDEIMASANIPPRVRRMWHDGELTVDSPEVREALTDAGVEHVPGVGLAQKLDGLAGFDANDPEWGWQRFQNYHGAGTPYVAVYEGTSVPYANDAQLTGESASLFKPRRLLGIVPSDQFNPSDWTEDAINVRLRAPSGIRMGITDGNGSVRGGPPDTDAVRAVDARLKVGHTDTPAYTRMYHGTGGDYATPDASRMSTVALFEDGLYLTSSPVVASSYADKARSRFQNAGLVPNVRPVNVPSDIKLLNMDAPLPSSALDDLIRAMPEAQLQGDPTWFRENVQRELDRRMRRTDRVGETPTYADLYKATQALIGAGSGDINRAIAGMGYDGVRYNGGLRTPLRDANGQPITHDAMVIFPEAWQRLRNAIDGSPLVPGAAATDPTVTLHAGIPLTKGRAIGALLGGTTGALWPADSPEERQMNMAKGLGLGLGAAVVGPQLLKVKNTLLTPAALREPELGAAMVRYNNGVRSVAATEAARARAAARPVEKVLAQEVRDGNVTLNAQGQAAVNTAIADARKQFGSTPLGDAVVARIKDNTYASALVGEHPEYYDLTTPQAQSVVADIRAQYDGIYAKAAANGVAPQQTRANYVNRAWDVPRSSSAAVKGKPLGTRQSYMQQASFDDFLQGLSQGYVPKSLNVSDLIAQHAAAVETAIAQKQLVNKILATPGWSFNPKVWDATAGKWVTRPVPDGYRAFDAPAFRKMFGTLDTADVRQAIADFELDALARGAPDAAARAALLRDLREEVGAGRSQIYVRDDVAQALDATFDPQGALARATDSTLGIAREAALGADVAMAGRVTPLMWLQAMAGSNPLRGTAAIGKALLWSIPKTKFGENARLSKTWQEWAPHFGNIGPNDLGAVLEQTGVEQSVLRRFANMDSVPGLRNIPVVGKWGVGKALGALEDWQFNTLIPNLEVATADAIYRSKAGRVAKMGDMAARDAIASRVETVAAGVSRMRAGTSRDQEALLRTFLLSPNFTRGALRSMEMLTKGGLEGDLARAHAAGLATFGMAFTVGMTMALQGDVSFDALDRLANPNNPDSITDPRSRNFMKIITPDGANIDIWGQFTPLFRTMYKPFATGIGAGAEGAAGAAAKSGDNPLYNGIAAGLHAAFGMDGTEPWRDWAENRLSIPLAAVKNLNKNEDSLGNAITNAPDGDARKWEQAKYIGKQFLPGVADIGLSQDSGPQPDFAVSSQTAQKGIAQFFGINATPGPNDPDAVTQKVSAFLQQNGVAVGVDPLGAYRRAVNDPDVIPRIAAEKFRADNPDIDKYIADTRARREALRQQPVGMEAAREYNTARANAQSQRTAALKAAADKYAQDHDGNAYRASVERAWTLYQGGLETAAKTILGVDSTEDAQVRIDKTYGGKDPSSQPAEKAFMEYESMRVPDNATPDQRDAVLSARRQFLAPGGTADQKYGAGTGDLLTRTIRERYRREGGETYGLYFDAQQTMGQYAAISPYIGMDARTARRAGAAIDRARALHQYGLSPSPLLAVLQDTEIDDDTRLAAMRIIKFGKRMVNPQRMAFRWQNPKMLTFYGDLNNEDFARLTGAA